MKNIFSKLVLVAILCSMVGSAYAVDDKKLKKKSPKQSTMQTKAASCKRAQSTATLSVNNVRAMINGYGNMWYDGSVAQYHLPKNSNTCPLYCAALWIGGTDVNDQLRIAALRFGSEGDDYWPGPLTTDGSATVDLSVCNEYDKHYVITKAEVQAMMAMFNYSDDGVEKNEAVYDQSAVAQVIQEWPAHGNVALGQSKYLAPFYDADGDGEYSWENGDYPYYDFDNALCPRTLKAALRPGENYSPTPTMEEDAGIVTGGILSDQVLKGDQTIWWVFNDMGNVHTETSGQPIGLEIRAQAFAFSTNDEINNMTFYTYEIINRSSYVLRDTYFSQWVDADLGYAYDDYVGCDVRRGLGYCYNGDESDGPGAGSYSGIPPAVGIDFFQGPYMDADGKDNPKIDIDKMRLYYADALSMYALPGGGYDTISLTDDADLYLDAWYFKPGDNVGNCAINGVNFGNNIVDDERFGMRRFVYYNNSTSGINSEPSKATDYYNYLRGYWKNGQRMTYGGNGIEAANLPCDFMFPGDSDPWNWGTDGAVPEDMANDWTELNVGNAPNDRRFMQSAGPFTLKPGALNYITVGIPFAQATSGNAWSSVELLRQIDDVCQALFENCFKVLDGPDAPTLIAQEMSNEIILYLTYENPESNNFGEKYSEVDPAIVRSYTGHDKDGNDTTMFYSDDERSYKFEGYQIYQMKDASASVADIGDVSKARLVAQCDIENYYDTVLYDENGKPSVNPNPSIPIGTLVNYTQNSSTGLLSGNIMVNGTNAGVRHVFRVTTDQFATGTSTALVNNREYYFIAVAYAHNRYKEYSQTEAAYLDGQKEPYLAGRKNEFGGTITAITAIPHDPSSENGGTLVQAEFGMCPNITRLEGHGNGGSILQLTQESIEELMGAPGVPGKGPGVFKGNGTSAITMENPCVIANPKYEENYGPINVRIIDPLNVKKGKFVINFGGVKDQSNWTLTNNIDGRTVYTDDEENYPNGYFVDDDGNKVAYIYDESDFVIGRYNEQLFLDLGVSVALSNPPVIATELINTGSYYYGGFVQEGAVLNSTMTFADNTKQWLSYVTDNDSYAPYNWIRSGSQYAASDANNFQSSDEEISENEIYLDGDYYKTPSSTGVGRPASDPVDKYQVFEGVLGGAWAPYSLASVRSYHPAFSFRYYVADEEIMDSLISVGRYNNVKSYNRTMRQMLNCTFNKSLMFNDLSALPSVRIVFTSDTSKWTRCPVIEMCDDKTQSENNARRFSMRAHASVDKNGRTCEDLGIEPDATDPSNPAYINAEGMGWFPGYAISLATGERLNVMFGEDSRFVQYNGRDMMWNPVTTVMEGSQNYVMGGRHYIYVMNSTNQPFFDITSKGYASTGVVTKYRTPSYDAGRWAVKMLKSIERTMQMAIGGNDLEKKFLYKGLVTSEAGMKALAERDSISLLYASCAWVNMPLVNSRYAFDNPQDIPCDVTVDINVNMPYGLYCGKNQTTIAECGVGAVNGDKPRYMFEMGDDVVTLTGIATADNARQSYKDSTLARINVVPNPYYSYSSYETQSQLETKIRITNLPTVKGGCVISIFSVDGTLVRQLTSAENSTTCDWDLHNHDGIPIAGGVYLIHVKVPGIGDRVIKWFGTMRPVDLNSYQF